MVKLNQLFLASSHEGDTHAKHARNCGRLILLFLLVALLPGRGHLDFGGFFGLLAIVFLVPLWIWLSARAVWNKQQLATELKLQPFLFAAIVIALKFF
jgi:hypothetical protein